MADKITVASLFTNIANAIRAKTDRNEKIVADEFPFALASIPNNGVFLSIIKKSVIDIPNSYLENLTSIGSHAFYNCRNLALTSLPESVTEIGGYAFYNCTNLALISLPESVTEIGGYAFYNCTNLKSLTFKGTPTSIGSYAFGNCIYLKTINVPWSEGEIAGAPWGATKATINYNYV